MQARSNFSRRSVALVALMTLVIGIIGGYLIALDTLNDDTFEASKIERGTEVVVESVAGSVVSITSLRLEDVRGGSTVQKQLQATIPPNFPGSTKIGSGFVFSEGYILTNNHVVEDSDRIEITFVDGTTVHASYLAGDRYSDLAVLEAKLPGGAKPLVLGNSSQVKIGEPVIAIGNPFGLSGSLTTGVVSQTHRTLSMVSGYSIPGVIQFDAAVNPGNSGGPLLNYQEQVIGVTTASETTGVGIGFAIPSNIVKIVAKSLIENGEYKYPWMGIHGKEVNLQIAEGMALEEPYGVLIIRVFEYGPADKAGLRGSTQIITVFGEPMKIGGDVIVEIDNFEIRTFEDLDWYLTEHKIPGDTTNLTILRNGEKIVVPLTLAERPPE